MRPPHFSMNFENSSHSVTCRNICRNSVTNLSTNRDAQHYEFRTIKILTCQYLVPLVSLVMLSNNMISETIFYIYIFFASKILEDFVTLRSILLSYGKIDYDTDTILKTW